MTAIASNFTTSGVGTTYTTDDDPLTLATDGYLISTVNDSLDLGGTSQNYDVTISGLLQGATIDSFAGLYLLGSNSATITVAKTGDVRGNVGIYLDGVADIVNDGNIFGVGNIGILYAGTGNQSLTNTGTIGSDNAAIYSASSGTLTIVNSGVISGNADANNSAILVESTSAIVLLTNTGKIVGGISLNDGADIIHNDTGAGVINGDVSLGNGANEFYGGLFADTVFGGADSDYIEGGNGIDVLTGGGGVDTLVGGAGDDSLTGGTGDDIYYVDSQDDVIIETAGDSGDTVFSNGSYALGSAADIEILSTTVDIGTDAIDLTGNALAAQTITGNDGNNVLNGGGDDGFEDVLFGRDGDDTYELGGELLDTVSDTSGIDTITSTIDRDLGLHDQIEKLVLLGTAMSGTGNALNNTITGNANANSLSGLGGIDTLIGGLGKDRLTGGAAADVFDFNAVTESGINAQTRDIIADFGTGNDDIDLATIDAIAGGANNAFGLLARGSASSAVGSGKIGYFWEDKAGSSHDKTILRINNDHDAGIEMTIELKGLHTLHTSDFVL